MYCQQDYLYPVISHEVYTSLHAWFWNCRGYVRVRHGNTLLTFLDVCIVYTRVIDVRLDSLNVNTHMSIYTVCHYTTATNSNRQIPCYTFLVMYILLCLLYFPFLGTNHRIFVFAV